MKRVKKKVLIASFVCLFFSEGEAKNAHLWQWALCAGAQLHGGKGCCAPPQWELKTVCS